MHAHADQLLPTESVRGRLSSSVIGDSSLHPGTIFPHRRMAVGTNNLLSPDIFAVSRCSGIVVIDNHVYHRAIYRDMSSDESSKDVYRAESQTNYNRYMDFYDAVLCPVAGTDRCCGKWEDGDPPVCPPPGEGEVPGVLPDWPHRFLCGPVTGIGDPVRTDC